MFSQVCTYFLDWNSIIIKSEKEKQYLNGSDFGTTVSKMVEKFSNVNKNQMHWLFIWNFIFHLKHVVFFGFIIIFKI